MNEDKELDEREWEGPERRRADRRSGRDRRREHGFTLRMIHELAQRFEQLSPEGRQRVVEFAKELLVEEMTEEPEGRKEQSQEAPAD